MECTTLIGEREEYSLYNFVWARNYKSLVNAYVIICYLIDETMRWERIHESPTWLWIKNIFPRKRKGQRPDHL
jgi:hypothetical protein